MPEEEHISYPQFLGAMLVMTLVVVLGYLVLVVAGQKEMGQMKEMIGLVSAKEMAHLQEAEVHIARIAKLEAQMEQVMTQPTARSDPFTGTEGKELKARLNQLQEKMKELHEHGQ